METSTGGVSTEVAQEELATFDSATLAAHITFHTDFERGYATFDTLSSHYNYTHELLS